MLHELSNVTTTTLYVEYIDRRKLTEQKSSFDCIVPPPLIWVDTKLTNT